MYPWNTRPRSDKPCNIAVGATVERTSRGATTSLKKKIQRWIAANTTDGSQRIVNSDLHPYPVLSH